MFDRHFAHWPPGAPRTLDIPRTSVYGNLAARAEQHPERTLAETEVQTIQDRMTAAAAQRCGARLREK